MCYLAPKESDGSEEQTAMDNISPKEGRLKVLVVAAAVHPRMGSEPGMGWNWLKALSEHHDLWVISGEYKDNRQAIHEEFSKEPRLAERIHFQFLPWFWPRKNPLARSLCNALPPLYYIWYKRWHKDAFVAAQRLASEIPFDLAHQLNMIGYREPGYLWRLGLPFVWGPVGGTNNAPITLSFSFGLQGAIVALGRTLLNHVQLLGSPRVAAALAHTDCLVNAITEGREKFLRHHGKDSVVISEVGTEEELLGHVAVPKAASPAVKLAWSGLHVNRKCLPLALRALAPHKGKSWSLDVLGTGPLTEDWKAEALRLGLGPHITWHGWMERQKAVAVMSGADVLLCSSLSEASSTVILEALSLAMPIVTLDHCGMADIVDDSCGIKVRIGYPAETIGRFSQAIGRFLAEPELLPSLSSGALARARQLRWPNLAKRMCNVYLRAIHLAHAAKAQRTTQDQTERETG